MVDQNQNESRALALSQPHADLPSESEWAILQRMAKAFAESGLYPNIKNVAQAIAIVQTGRELGVPPSAALRTINIISGKPTEAAELMAALIYRDQGSDALRVTESTNERCVVRYKRREWEGYEEITFSMEDAARADLLVKRPDQKGKSNWEKYPRAMLRSRAISEAARSAFADSILGMYTAEEIAPERVVVTPEGEVVLEGAEVPSRVVDARTGEVLTAGPLGAETVAPAAPQPAGPEGGTPEAPAAAVDATDPVGPDGDGAAALATPPSDVVAGATGAGGDPLQADGERSEGLPLVLSGRIAAAAGIEEINRVLDEATKARSSGQITVEDRKALFAAAKERISGLPSRIGAGLKDDARPPRSSSSAAASRAG